MFQIFYAESMISSTYFTGIYCEPTNFLYANKFFFLEPKWLK